MFELKGRWNQREQTSQSQQEVEQALETHQALLQKIFEHSNDAIFVIDANYDQILEANPKASELLGYSRQELLQSVRVSNIHPQEMSELRAFGESVLQQGYGWTNELSCLTKSGYQLPSEISASVIPFQGKTCIICFVRDVSARKAAEQARQRSENRFRTFVENAADAFFMVDGEGKIEDINQQACQSLGYRRQELLGKAVTDIDATLSSTDIANLKAELNFDQPKVIESWHRRKDGSVFPVEINICRFGNEQNPQEIALARDITERKQAETARARLAEIGELASMIVHEVRNPLTTILMGLESLQELELPSRSRMRINFALEEGERLKKLLNEVLQYAREQNLELELVDIDLVSLINDLQPVIRDLSAAEGRSIQFDTTLSEAWIQGDVNKLKQVFLNLISNALEAIEEGETVTCRIDPAPQPQHICVSIHNGGDPIPPEVLEKLGTPFLTTKSQGNGLGVALVKRIIDAHQGQFSMESTAEKGTTARVILPFNENVVQRKT